MEDRFSDLCYLVEHESVYDTPSIRWAVEEIKALRRIVAKQAADGEHGIVEPAARRAMSWARSQQED